MVNGALPRNSFTDDPRTACAPREDSDQTAQSDQSLRCPHDESLGP